MFPLIKQIVSKSGDLHFCRWRILENRFFSIYLHLICKSDDDKHLHNHPWHYLSVVLLGGYEEELLTQKDGYDSWRVLSTRQFIPRLRGRNMFHKLKLVEPTLSLVITGKRYDSWHFWLSPSRKVTNTEYRELKAKGLLPI